MEQRVQVTIPPGVYYARVRVQGKLIVKSLNTTVLSVAKLRLGDFEKSQRRIAEDQVEARQGKMSFADAITTLRSRIAGDAALKPATRSYYEWRLVALLKSWPGLGLRDVRSITKSECLDWAAKFAKESSGTAFNNTVSVLRRALDAAVEQGVRYHNPAGCIRRVGVRPKKLILPEYRQFHDFVRAIETAGGRESRNCADLVRFLAFSGLRIGEARNVKWADCDFNKAEITVHGDASTGTKNSEVRRIPMIADMATFLKGLREDRSGDLNVLRQQIPNEARLRPRAGERPAAASAGVPWTAVWLGEDSYQLDFVELVNKAKPEADTVNQVAYAVAYIVSETPQTGLMLLAGSDDTARVYLNEKEIHRQLSTLAAESG